MFNTPIFDVAIGLIFVFLIYSLLATSVKEGIASAFALRARMLKTGITVGMLSDTKETSPLKTIAKMIVGFLDEIQAFFTSKRIAEIIFGEKEGSELGDKFYEHPLIKNYGSSGLFPHPSYIPTKNFSNILIDVLKNNFDIEKDKIAARLAAKPNGGAVTEITDQLTVSSDAVKIKELLDYYEATYFDYDMALFKQKLTDIAAAMVKANTKANAKKSKNRPVLETDVQKITDALNGLGDDAKIKALHDYLKATKQQKENKGPDHFIHAETLAILQLHLRNSAYVITAFDSHLQEWFEESMNRVSGWYKRQVQVILLLIGLVIAFVLNVDTIGIAQKLSRDKTIRAQMVQLAIASTDKYKNDPRVKPNDTSVNNKIYVSDSAGITGSIMAVQKQLDGDNKDLTNLLALNWGDYGRSRDSLKVINQYTDAFNCLVNDVANQPENKRLSVAQLHSEALCKLYNKHWYKLKLHFMWSSIGAEKLMGFLLTAFAISLGAPFWFDMLNKTVNLRGTGVKEDGADGSNQTAATPKQAPVTVSVNTQKSEEAAG